MDSRPGSGFEITDLAAVQTGDVEVVTEERGRLWLFKFVIHDPDGPRVVGASPSVYAAQDLALGGGKSLLCHLRRAA